jgi:predicted TIM-barrel fold metal-dependent hydrolase
MSIDAQMHLWATSVQHPIPESVRQRHGEHFTIEQAFAQMDSAGVDRTMLVPLGVWRSGPAKNGYPTEGARRYPERFVVEGLDFLLAEDRSRVLGLAAKACRWEAAHQRQKETAQ